MTERLDPVKHNAPPGPARPPFWCALAGFLVFTLGAMLAYVLFTALMLWAEPTRNSLLAVLAFFALFAGTGASSGLGLFVYHRLGRKVTEARLRREMGGVFTGDRRS